MKKMLSVLLALSLLLMAVPAFADVAADVEAGQALTHDELVEKAKAESGTFVVYGNTSIHPKGGQVLYAKPTEEKEKHEIDFLIT